VDSLQWGDPPPTGFNQICKSAVKIFVNDDHFLDVLNIYKMAVWSKAGTVFYRSDGGTKLAPLPG
jgi:hypothetical protein